MKIIKQGTIKKKVAQKTCKECGTIFEFEEKDEKRYDSDGDGDYNLFYVICPFCKEHVSITYKDRCKVEKYF